MVITPTLTKIINKCIEMAVFPDNLKTAEVIPVFKKGDKRQVTNYRPISLLSPFSKIYERHLHTQIINFINKHNILHPFQYGFRKNYSTEQAINQISEQLISNMEDKLYSCAVFLDLAKAFDTIDHQILINKLHHYGIRGLAGQLIKNYLSNRTQRTKINNVFSNYNNITSGIPQGSILGPLLFILYINDMPHSSNFIVRLFADDACLILANKDQKLLEITVNQELQKIEDWIQINKLTVNYEKSKFVIFNRKNSTKQFRIKMQGNQIEQLTDIKYLGIQLDDKLNWKKQINRVKTKLSSASYIIAKSKNYLDQQTLKLLYYTLAFPHINYCLTAWGGTYKTTLQPIVKLQNRIIRIISYNSFLCPTKPLYLHHKILPFNQLYKLNTLILIHKIKNKTISGYTNILQLTNTHNYNTRISSSNNYYQHYNRTTHGQSTSSVKGTKFWQTIPVELKELPLYKFKCKLKERMFIELKEEIT